MANIHDELLILTASNEDDTEGEYGLTEREEISAETLFPKVVHDRLRRVFTIRGIPYFEFYSLLKRIELGEPAPSDLKQQYVLAANRLIQVTSPVDGRPLSPVVVNLIAESRTDLSLYLGRLAAGNIDDNLTWVKINNILVPIYLAAARDKEIYLSAIQRGRRRWAIFRRMSNRQEKLEQLRDVNPEAFQLVQKYNQSLDEIDQAIQRRISRSGQVVQKGFLAGRQVLYGVDPTTQEKRVYDMDGDVLTPEEYIVKRREKLNAEKKLSAGAGRVDVHPNDLRKVSDEDIAALTGTPELVSITDDKAKQGKMTRIFQVRKKPVLIQNPDGDTSHVTSIKVITSGRYKGVYLDDMVNATGRMIEGSSYTYSPLTGRAMKVPKRIDPASREPYVTVAEVQETRRIHGLPVKKDKSRLFIKVPGTRQYKGIRDALKTLSCNSPPNYPKRGCVTSIEFHPVEGSNAAGFYFDEKDFGTILDATQGLSLSTAALDKVRDYYKDLAYAEQATAKTNLGNYTATAIGGFKAVKKQRDGSIKPFNLSTQQKRSLAWLDANGNKGVCGMDTGMGKSLVGIAAMQKMIRDGVADPDASYNTPDGNTVQTNGRFLFVCPTTLKGNLPKEMRQFLSDPALLIDRTDVISYREFNASVRSLKVPRSIKADFWKGRPWDPSLYVAIFFDEAQQLMSNSRDKPASKAEQALQVWHPRKICLTASPIERNPMEAFILGAVCNNMPLSGETEEAKANSKEMRKFKERFCEVVGDRIVGVKEEPTIKQDLDVWVRRNIFYADKQDVDVEAGETPLATLRAGTQAITMDPAVEQVYRGAARQFAKTLGGMVNKFRDRAKGGPGAPSAREPDIELLINTRSELAPVMRLLNGLSNYPKVALTDLADMVDSDKYTQANGKQVPIPKSLAPIVAWMRAKIGADGLRQRASTVGNPKLQTAGQVIKTKLRRTNGGTRTILFSDDRKMCEMAARQMSETIPGQHVLALDNSISIYEGGQPQPALYLRIEPDVVRKILGDAAQADDFLSRQNGVITIPLPLKKKSYRRYPELPATKTPENLVYRADNWQTFAFNEIIAPDSNFKSMTLLGQSYQYGHNLQAFDTVIHLDRDTWNSESMKQRTARVWRQGQDKPVTEITLDTTYAETKDDFDRTTDQIQRMFQQMEAEVFDAIIKGAQTIALGKEWSGITREHASIMKLDHKMLELAASPYSSFSVPPGEV